MPKILVIDDDKGILDAMFLILDDAGYQVQTSIKQSEIYRKISQFKPDLIFLDILMSGQDGRVICKKLKQEPTFKKIPVIMISAHPNAAKGAKDCGADDFLAKPFEIKDLLSLVKKYLED